MKQRMHLFSTVFLGLTFFAVNATAQTVSWKQIVGIALAGNVVGSGSGAVTGGFLPWTATTGAARVDLREGKVEFVFRGLVFAGGAPGITIGTLGPVTAVQGTLVCDVDGSAGGGNSVLVQTPSVRLSSTGEAFFSGRVGTLPAACSSEADIAFLVHVTKFGDTATTQGPWIANGAVQSRRNDNDRDKDDN